MRRIAMLCLSSLFLTGCTDATVREYAAKLAAQLKSYQTQLDRNLAAERRLYNEVAAVFAVEAEREMYESLFTERLRASFAEARRLEGTTTLFDEQEFMRRQTEKEFESTKDFFQREMTLPEQSMAGLRRLELNTQKVASLAAALQAFTVQSNLPAIAADLERFKSAFDSEVARQTCIDLAAQAAITKESLANAQEEKAGNVQALTKKLAQQKVLSESCKTK
jgi:hypothetical protein